MHYFEMSFSYSVFIIFTVKALLSPQGAYLILDLPEGGLIERGLLERGAYLKIK